MQKNLIQSIINKYYLRDNINTVKWAVKSKVLTIKFMSPSHDMIGSINIRNFDLEDCEFVIYDSSQLLKLISILEDDVRLELVKKHELPINLKMSDSKFKQTYFLSDIMLAPKVGKVKDIGPFDLDFDISEVSTDLIKAKEALKDSDKFIFESDLSSAKFIFGEDNNFSNKIELEVPLTNPSKISTRIPFNSLLFKEILYSNKDLPSGRVSINIKGLMRLEFSNEDGTFYTQYNLLRVSN